LRERLIEFLEIHAHKNKHKQAAHAEPPAASTPAQPPAQKTTVPPPVNSPVSKEALVHSV